MREKGWEVVGEAESGSKEEPTVLVSMSTLRRSSSDSVAAKRKVGNMVVKWALIQTKTLLISLE